MEYFWPSFCIVPVAYSVFKKKVLLLLQLTLSKYSLSTNNSDVCFIISIASMLLSLPSIGSIGSEREIALLHYHRTVVLLDCA